MYEDILLPTDGSEGFEKVEEQVLEIAKKFDSTIHVMSVVESRAMMYNVDVSRLVKEMEQFAQQETQEMAENAREKGIPVLEETPNGIPHQEILDYTEEKGIDLIVMGTHGRTGLSRLVIGSVAEKVVRKSSVPVMTTGLEGEEEP